MTRRPGGTLLYVGAADNIAEREMRYREQNEAVLNLDELTGTIDLVRDMLGRLAQPQRGDVARALFPSLMTLERAMGRLAGDVLKARDGK
jgi:hypothetical protein